MKGDNICFAHHKFRSACVCVGVCAYARMTVVLFT